LEWILVPTAVVKSLCLEGPGGGTRRVTARRRRGRVELATARSIREIGDLPRGLGGLAEVALTLARSLDDGAGLAVAAVARELRATLTKLAEDPGDDGEPDPFEAEIAAFSRPVPADLGYGKDGPG
jgi:hypothetical protein